MVKEVSILERIVKIQVLKFVIPHYADMESELKKTFEF